MKFNFIPKSIDATVHVRKMEARASRDYSKKKINDLLWFMPVALTVTVGDSVLVAAAASVPCSWLTLGGPVMCGRLQKLLGLSRPPDTVEQNQKKAFERSSNDLSKEYKKIIFGKK